MYNFYAFLSRMKHIKRWGLMRNTEIENIKEHSFDTTVVAHALALIRNKYFGGNIDVNKVMAVALYHETSEVITGDLATPIKYYNPEIRDAYKAIENIAVNKMLNMLPEELVPEYKEVLLCEDSDVLKVVKAADKLCAYIKCIEETKFGNQEFSKAMEKIGADLMKNSLPEVKYFIENIIPSYALTLDELN